MRTISVDFIFEDSILSGILCLVSVGRDHQISSGFLGFCSFGLPVGKFHYINFVLWHLCPV